NSGGRVPNLGIPQVANVVRRVSRYHQRGSLRGELQCRRVCDRRLPHPAFATKNMTREVGTFNNTEYSPTVNSPFPSGGARRGNLHKLQEEARWYRNSLGWGSRELLTSPTA